MDKINVPSDVLALARTVTYYEEAQSSVYQYSSRSSTHGLYTLARYFVSRNGERQPKLLWSMLLKLGINPLALPTATVSNPYDVGYGSTAYKFSVKPHLLMLAAVFDDADAPIAADDFIQRIEEDAPTEAVIEARDTRYATKRSELFTFDAPECCYLVPPPQTRSRERTGLDFRPELAAWYTADAIAEQLARYTASGEATLLRRIADTLKAAGGDLSTLQQAVQKYLKRTTTKASGAYAYRQYGEIAMLLQYGERDELLKFLDTCAENKKAHALLGVALPEPPSGVMIHGLRALCAADGTAAMKHMTRGPTLAELQRCRIKGIMHVLYMMPWVLLEPLIRTYPNEVRALLVSEAPKNLEKARLVFQDHGQRVKLSEVEDVAYSGTSSRKLGNFAEFKHGIRSRYDAAQVLYRETQRLPPEVAITLIMDHLVPLEHLSGIRVLRKDRALDAALSAWKSPLTNQPYTGSTAPRYVQLPY